MLKDLFKSKNYMDIYRIARWAYKVNSPIMRDVLYDEYEDMLKKKYPEEPIFKTSYEDDTEPTDLLLKYDIVLQDTIKGSSIIVDSEASVLDNEPLSQNPIRKIEDAYLWYKKMNGLEICHSLKIDGISTRVMLSKRTGIVQRAYSKGRAEIETDFTDTVKKVLNKGISKRKSEGNNIIVAAEGIIGKKNLEFLNNILGTTYKNGRSAALGILTAGMQNDFYSKLELYAFGASSLTGSYTDSLVILEELGFKTVPRMKTRFVDEGFDEFKTWISNITKNLYKQAERLDIAADGVVARVDDIKKYNTYPVDLYSDASIALKFNEFSAKTYTTLVKDLVMDFSGSSSENYTMKLILEPFQTDDNKVISKITGYNLAYLISKGIKKGSTVEVLYQSGCYPMLA